MLGKFAAAAALAVVAVLSVPAAAHAGGPYVGAGEVVVTGDRAPGGTVVVSYTDGSFLPKEDVDIRVIGDTAVTLAVVTTGPITKVADAEGAVSVSITLPANASGAYQVIASQGTRTLTAAFSVAGANGGSGTGTGTTTGTGTGTGSSTGNGLASTGQDLPLTALFVGGGALLLGAIVLGAVRTTRRRSVARQN